MQTVPFSGETRDLKIKSKVVRDSGRIPAVIYGGGVMEHFSVVHNDVKNLIFTPDFKIGELTVGGTTHKCIVKDIQWHPMTDAITHIDFLALKEGTMVNVDIPVKFKGVSPGIKAGGSLMQTMRRVKVKLDPKNIVDELYIDISHLELGDAVRVSEIEVPDNIEIMVDKAVPVATVEVPRALRSATAAEEDSLQDAPAAEAAPEA